MIVLVEFVEGGFVVMIVGISLAVAFSFGRGFGAVDFDEKVGNLNRRGDTL